MSGPLARLRKNLEHARATVAGMPDQPDDAAQALLDAMREHFDIISAATERIAEEAYLTSGRLGGLYRGAVVENVDPMNRGRLQVEVAAEGGRSSWALCSWPLGTSPPQPAAVQGDMVWVMYEEGDRARPVVIGACPA